MDRLIKTVNYLIDQGLRTDKEVARLFLTIDPKRDRSFYADVKIIIMDLERLQPYGLKNGLQDLLTLYLSFGKITC